jgi:SNF2 family DNA or RNA helicase
MKKLLSQACVAGWLDPGLGKTSCSLGAFKILKNQSIVKRMLVVAPLRVCWMVWPKELMKWKEFSKLKMVILHGNDKDDLLDEDADIFVINPEGLEWFIASGGMSRVKPDVLCIDESRKFAKIQSQRFKILKKEIGKFRRRWTLTGTPAPNGYMDVFGQIYLTDGGASLGTYITKYRTDFFDSTGFGGHTYVLQDDGESRIIERVRPIVMRLDAEDYLKLPKWKWNDVVVELPPKARRVYDEMESLMLTMLDKKGTTVTAASAAAVSMKCRQVANGGLYLMPETDDCGLLIKSRKREWVNLHDEKVKACADIVEELGGKGALVAYDFEHDLTALLKHFGKNTPRIGESIRRDIQLERMWNNKELEILLGHPQSMGHGLNLQNGGADVIWYALTWDFELYDQFNKRVRRQGSKHKVVRVHRIIAHDTVDEAILAALPKKESTQKKLLDALRVFYRQRNIKQAAYHYRT